MENSASSYKCRAYFFVCTYHVKRLKKKIVSNYKTRQKFQQMGVEVVLICDYQLLLREVATYDFDGYASWLLFAEFKCFNKKISHPMQGIYKAIQRNNTIKFVTKLVMHFEILEVNTVRLPETNNSHNSYNQEQQLPSIYDSEFPFTLPVVYESNMTIKPMDLQQALDNFPFEAKFDGVVLNDKIRYDDKFCDAQQAREQENAPNIDNYTFIQCNRKEFPTTKSLIDTIYKYMINFSQKKSVQEIAKLLCAEIRSCSSGKSLNLAYYTSTCAGEGYVFQINPALVFMINHITFPKQRKMPDRPYSLQDIPVVQRTFMKKKIKCYTFLDASLKDVQQLMQQIRSTNFTWLKYLYILISSHGDIGDIIYTKSGIYSIKDDIAKSFLLNPTLAHVQKFILVNACRGDIDTTKIYCSEEIMELIEINKDNAKLDYFRNEKLMIIYSTQKGFVSFLYPNGTVFLQTFCEVFEDNFDETSMEVIGQKVIKKMDEYVFYDQIPDFGINYDLKHNIKMEFINYFGKRKALANIAKIFKNKFQQNAVNLDIRKSIVETDNNQMSII